MRALTNTSAVVLFSAAIPMQGGTGHVNEQWPEYWAEQFAELGYVPVDAIRRRVWTNAAVEWWYAQNALLYVRESELGKFPKLEAEVRQGFSTAVPLVHPKRYVRLLQHLASRPPAPPPFAFRLRRKVATLFHRVVG